MVGTHWALLHLHVVNLLTWKAVTLNDLMTASPHVHKTASRALYAATQPSVIVTRHNILIEPAKIFLAVKCGMPDYQAEMRDKMHMRQHAATRRFRNDGFSARPNRTTECRYTAQPNRLAHNSWQPHSHPRARTVCRLLKQAQLASPISPIWKASYTSKQALYAPHSISHVRCQVHRLRYGGAD